MRNLWRTRSGRTAGVVFATVHVVGTRNNKPSNIPGAVDEWRERDMAVEAWIRVTFSTAKQVNAPGVALFFQADPFAEDRGQPGYLEGFERFLKTIEEEAQTYLRPVLLVHADEHRYRLNFGMRFHASGAPVPHVTRLETFGAANLHAVLVTVDPQSLQVFVPGPLIVPGNALPVLPRPKAGR